VTFAQLRSYQEVARHGSVTEAARVLGVTEPAVSSAVCSLRRELGDDLFVRAPGGIRFTPGGQRLAQYAAQILMLAEAARNDLAKLH
jgi:LysR family transcriptional regulator, low CO2-responsive transcriptional regulator